MVTWRQGGGGRSRGQTRGILEMGITDGGGYSLVRERALGGGRVLFREKREQGFWVGMTSWVLGHVHLRCPKVSMVRQVAGYLSLHCREVLR